VKECLTQEAQAPPPSAAAALGRTEAPRLFAPPYRVFCLGPFSTRLYRLLIPCYWLFGLSSSAGAFLSAYRNPQYRRAQSRIKTVFTKPDAAVSGPSPASFFWCVVY
jgi:hypothetical protein